eukprot:1809975-Prymnesium_polylepis.1
MGRRPKLKSEEFFVSTILIEIIANSCLKPPKSATLIRSTTLPRRSSTPGGREYCVTPVLAHRAVVASAHVL